MKLLQQRRPRGVTEGKKRLKVHPLYEKDIRILSPLTMKLDIYVAVYTSERNDADGQCKKTRYRTGIYWVVIGNFKGMRWFFENGKWVHVSYKASFRKLGSELFLLFNLE